MASPPVCTLTPTMAPNKSRVFLTIFRKTVIGSNTGTCAFKSAHFKTNETRDHTAFFPLMMNFDFKWFSFGIIALPERGRRLGDLVSTSIG